MEEILADLAVWLKVSSREFFPEPPKLFPPNLISYVNYEK